LGEKGKSGFQSSQKKGKSEGRKRGVTVWRNNTNNCERDVLTIRVLQVTQESG